MNVFISWSGERSRLVAEVLRNWISHFFDTIQFYVSSIDMEKGTRWIEELSSELDSTNYGIICVTNDNFEAPWLMYEAGALSKAVGESFVVPFLFDVSVEDIQGPLRMFQSVLYEKDDINLNPLISK